ncbi:hypothetical protein Lfu02_17540 [Longispora fulva]|uniref:Uncharacterized protein n=2 Tax=Longispora fulva TaxID=619741 RepID=A0A8J7KMA4_9ACTN|nr:hypothetical protein [Longispora fulva]MBG6140239.1 hypothetical protein [Longispora fulva]GIG57382.1 hypothetical protein Lfu02_17540 [Longispora fulva]
MQGTAFHVAVEQWERSGRSIDPLPIFYAEYDRLIEEAKARA